MSLDKVILSRRKSTTPLLPDNSTGSTKITTDNPVKSRSGKKHAKTSPGKGEALAIDLALRILHFLDLSALRHSLPHNTSLRRISLPRSVYHIGRLDFRVPSNRSSRVQVVF